MSWAIKCDLCGNYEDIDNATFKNLIPDTDAVRIRINGDEHTFWLCKGCSNKIYSFMKNLQKESTNA